MKTLLLFAWLAANDWSGTWSGSMIVTDDRGDKDIGASLLLKEAEGKITGAVGPNGEGRVDIQNARLEDGVLRFEAAPPGPANAIWKFELRRDGQRLQGTVTAPMGSRTVTGKVDLQRQ